ncbi:MAG: hypothetical protein ACTSV2_16570 [Candidatus Thorarchaeota archaeon]
MKFDKKPGLTLLLFSVFLITSVSVQPQLTDTSLAIQYPMLAEEQVTPDEVPVWVVVPTDLTFEYGDYVSFTLNATSPSGFVIYWISDAKNFEFNYLTGQVWGNGVLDLGEYPLWVLAMDDTYTKILEMITIYIVDSVAPVIAGPDDMEVYGSEASGTLVWDVYDLAPYIYKIFKDSTLIEVGPWNSTVESLSISYHNLAVGLHTYTLELMDTSGNTTIDDVLIEVISDELTSTVIDSLTTPDDTITSSDDHSTPTSPSIENNPLIGELVIVLLAGTVGIISVFGVLSFLISRKAPN